MQLNFPMMMTIWCIPLETTYVGWHRLDFATTLLLRIKKCTKVIYHVTCGWIFGYKRNGRVNHIKGSIAFLLDALYLRGVAKKSKNILLSFTNLQLHFRNFFSL